MPSRPLPFPVLFAGAGPGAAPLVRAFDAETGGLLFERAAFEAAFTGGVRVAAADLTRDGFPDVVAAAGPGGGPRVRVLDGKTGDPVGGPAGDFFAYDPSFTGGVSVAAADVDGDTIPDIVTAAGAGGGPHVRVFSGATGAELHSFFALDPDFRGGASVAAADFTGDRRAEVAVGAGPGGGPRVRVIDPATGRSVPGPLGDFFAADPLSRGGANVGADGAAGDVDADGRADLLVGSGPGAASRVVVYSGATGAAVRDFRPFGPGVTAGVRVAAAFVDDDAYADIVAGTGPGVAAEIRVFSGKTGGQLPGPAGVLSPFGAGELGGVFVGASNDPPPVVVSVRALDRAMAEARLPSVGPGPSAALVEVSRAGDWSQDLDVYLTRGGTATPDLDYTAAPAFADLSGYGPEWAGKVSVTIPTGKRSVLVRLDAVDDTAIEGPEAVGLAVLPRDGVYVVSATAGADAVDLADNDPSPDPAQSVWVESYDKTLQAVSNTATVTLRRALAVGYAPLSVNWAITANTAGAKLTTSLATDQDGAPDPYNPGVTYGTFTFMPGQDAASFTFKTLNYPTFGQVTITLSALYGSGYTIAGSPTLTLDAYVYGPSGGVPAFTDYFGIPDGEASSLSAGGYARRFVVNRFVTVPPNAPPVTVPPRPPLDYVLGGRARYGADYTATKYPATSVLLPHQSNQQYVDGYEVWVTPRAGVPFDKPGEVDFVLVQDNGEYVAQHIGIGNHYAGGVAMPLVAPPPPPTVTVVAPDPWATEGTKDIADTKGAVTKGTGPIPGLFRFERDDALGLAKPLTVYFAMSGAATFSADYALSPYCGGNGSYLQVTFPAGRQAVEVKLTPVQDGLNEGNEPAVAQLLSGYGYGYQVGQYDKATVTITEENLFYPVSIGDRVWLDANGDGKQDVEEYGLSGVTVHLEQNGTELVSPVVTTENGYYQFSVTAKEGDQFRVKVDVPDGFKVSPMHKASDPLDSDIFESGWTDYFLAPAKNPDPTGTTVVDTKDAALRPTGDLVLVNSDGNEVADNLEENPGGWVSVNNDNDNYNFVAISPEALSTSTAHLFDMSESGKVEGENDLVEIRVKDLAAQPGLAGSYKLEWTSERIKVWKSKDKEAGALASGTGLTGGQTLSYWVEGMSLSTATMAESIKLNWVADGRSTELDKANFTVYEVTGPMNVPGHSIHKYTYKYPGGIQDPASGWDPPVQGGQYVKAYPSVTADSYTTASHDILWGEGAYVGKYFVHMPNSFRTDREVNVVQVSLGISQGSNQLVLDDTSMSQSQTDKRHIHSAATNAQWPAMYASLNVIQIRGPIDNQNRQRGIRFIDMGFMQVITMVSLHADYNDQNPKKRRKNSIEGNTYIDSVSASDKPWYQKQYVLGTLNRSYRAAGRDGNGDTPADDVQFSMTDSPHLSATDQLVLVGDNVDYFSIVAGFGTYFAVHTLESVFDSDRIYTKRADGGWTWNGSGNISNTSAHTWMRDPAVQALVASNNGKFAELSNGSFVPFALTEGTTFNVAVNTPSISYFTTVDQ